MAEKDQVFVEYVVKALVDHPDDVKVGREIDEMGVLISLEVNNEDMGKIIGKEGRTAKAIRTLLRVIGAQNNARVNMKILEPEGREPQAREDKVEAESSEKPIKDSDDVEDSDDGEEKATELV